MKPTTWRVSFLFISQCRPRGFSKHPLSMSLSICAVPVLNPPRATRSCHTVRMPHGDSSILGFFPATPIGFLRRVAHNKPRNGPGHVACGVAVEQMVRNPIPTSEGSYHHLQWEYCPPPKILVVLFGRSFCPTQFKPSSHFHSKGEKNKNLDCTAYAIS